MPYLAIGLYACARAQHERREGDEESFSSSRLNRLSHSSQSSLETLLAAPQACDPTGDNGKPLTLRADYKELSSI
jgi:hypothetical protein